MNVININPKLYIKYIDDIKGFGVFANQKIKKGESIEQCYSICVDKTVKGFDEYSFYYRGDSRFLPLGFGMIYNHSNTPNIKWKIIDENKRIIHFFAINDIDIDDELCHNYGKLYLKNKPLL
jgi:SET domain-containing protein